MVDGRLVALDTPAALKRRWVPELVLVARGRGLVAAAAALRREAGVSAVEPFGAALHLRVDPASWDAARARAALSAAGARDVVVEEGSPSLEDVFLAVIGRAGGAA
jgi:ABC-2 type transport system ATP-binding protein